MIPEPRVEHPPPREPLEVRRGRAISLLRSQGSIVVALSGGVDSAALLALAAEALGPRNVLAATGVSDAVVAGDVADAAKICAHLGVEHAVVPTREMDRAGYRANSGDRCFHCRSELFELLREMARQRGYAAIAYGAILDDLGEVRPGMEAARRLGILAPLLEAGLGKDDVRALAKSAGLHVNDKPASPCLASRVPVGTEVTPERLATIGRAEAALHALGLRVVRVRHHGDSARVELDRLELERLDDPAFRDRVVTVVRESGFRFVTIDTNGYAGPRERHLPSALIQRIGPKRSSGQ